MLNYGVEHKETNLLILVLVWMVDQEVKSGAFPSEHIRIKRKL